LGEFGPGEQELLLHDRVMVAPVLNVEGVGPEAVQLNWIIELFVPVKLKSVLQVKGPLSEVLAKLIPFGVSSASVNCKHHARCRLDRQT
jgi:hypothetical protein